MATAQYPSAMLKFQEALAHPQLAPAERVEAHNGLGWARGKQHGMVHGLADFAQAGNHLESVLGRACALVQRGRIEDIRLAVDLFESLGLGDLNHQLAAIHTAIGVSSAEARAMLAYAYYWRNDPGDPERALAQIRAARQQDGSPTSTVGQIYNTLKKLRLPGLT